MKHLAKWMMGLTVAALLSAAACPAAGDEPEGKGPVYGGQFMDRLLPMPLQGKLTSDTWGADRVKPRDVDNGIEDRQWSYWGGNAILADDGKYHLYVARWREDSARGHMEWGRSLVAHAVADKPMGPYRVKDTVGKGHNPEVFQLTDGRYVIYVIGGYYMAAGVDGPWEYKKFEFDPRGRRIIQGLSKWNQGRLVQVRTPEGVAGRTRPGNADAFQCEKRVRTL